MFRLLGTLIMGALVGWIAGKLMDAEGSLLRNIIVGIIGSAVGGAAANPPFASGMASA